MQCDADGVLSGAVNTPAWYQQWSDQLEKNVKNKTLLLWDPGVMGMYMAPCKVPLFGWYTKKKTL